MTENLMPTEGQVSVSLMASTYAFEEKLGMIGSYTVFSAMHRDVCLEALLNWDGDRK